MSLQKSRPNLTDYQKSIIRYSHSNGKSVDEIREIDQLRRADGSKILKSTVKKWIERINQTGYTNTLSKSGRPRALNNQQESEVLKFIDRNPKKNYSVVAARFQKFNIKPRTVNNYAIRNGYSELKSLLN